MTEEQSIEEILDTIGDQRARHILAEISHTPRSAQVLADTLGYSMPTVYRRLALLKEHNLVKTQTLVAENGNHYDRFKCNFNSTVISLEGDEYDVQIFRQENLPDRFSQLWDDLHDE